MIRVALVLSLLLHVVCVHAFDHAHTVWDGLLKRHVVLSDGGNGSRVNYRGVQAERELLVSYLKRLSSVTPGEYDGWGRDQKLAFLINAYNAFTVELILTGYPEITSIRDLGGLFRSPWKRRFFDLLGERRHLDNLEHDLIRAPGVFNEPRIHFAVNCASIGCPMLRNEAYVAERLDGQLEDAVRRFLSDRGRNRYEAERGVLRLSKIFDWYAEDFTGSDSAISGLKRFLSAYAAQLAEASDARQRVKSGVFRIDYLDYDWRLNDVTRDSVVSDNR